MEFDEYFGLLPPERLPSRHVTPPALRANSSVTITLFRSVCFGRCPSYTVTVGSNGIIFDGHCFVAAEGKHTDRADPDGVRDLARKFIEADFYSMEDRYEACVTDVSTTSLSISIDGDEKRVIDHVGHLVGMPAVIRKLEKEVDLFARTARWIKGRRHTR